MADQSDENRLAPLDRGPDFDPNPSLEVSGDEAEYSVPRRRTRSLPQASTEAPITPNPSSKLAFGTSSPTEAQLAVSRRQDGFIAYFSPPTGERVSTEPFRPNVADITISGAGIEAMNEKWRPSDQWVEPAIRWIHLPGNNPDWVWVGMQRP